MKKTRKQLWRSLTDRLLARIKKRKNGCWEYTGHIVKSGYGTLKVPGGLLPGGKEKQVGVHRIAYRLFVGKLKKGLCICHKCNNPVCCNPKHLYQGTYKDNAQDKIKAGSVFISWGEKSGRCKLTRSQVMYIRTSSAKGIDLASKFGVAKSTISLIRNYKSRCYE